MSSGSTSRPRFETWRLAIIYIGVILAFTGLLFRLINLQVVQGSKWTSSAVENYTSEVNVPAPRGIIYDRNGSILARNLASYNIVITPANLPDDDSDIQRIYRELSDLIDVPVGGPVTDEIFGRSQVIRCLCVWTGYWSTCGITGYACSL